MEQSPIKVTYELSQGTLMIQCNVYESNGIISTTLSVSFIRSTDGKTFQRFITDDEIKTLHPMFFDTSLIRNVLEITPKSLQFFNCELNDTLESECVDITWIFRQAILGNRPLLLNTETISTKTKEYPITIRILEKQYSSDTNQQIIDLTHALTYCKQHIANLESLWTTKYDELCKFLPSSSDGSMCKLLKISDMQSLSLGYYGKVTGFDQYFAQFKSTDDLSRKLFTKKIYDELDKNEKYYYDNYPHRKLDDNSDQHIQKWIVENNLRFDEIKSAEIHLNIWIEENEYELIDIRVTQYHRLFYRNISVYTAGDPSNMSMIYGDKLSGYFRAANPHKKYIYIIAKSTDPILLKQMDMKKCLNWLMCINP